MKYTAGMKILQSEIAHFFPSQLLLLSNFLFEKIHFGTNFFIMAILSLFYPKNDWTEAHGTQNIGPVLFGIDLGSKSWNFLIFTRDLCGN